MRRPWTALERNSTKRRRRRRRRRRRLVVVMETVNFLLGIS
jgi:hypothetical protein